MRNTFILLGTLFTLLVNRQSAFSQNKFHPGYIIHSSGDTANGFVKLNSQIKTPSSIFFKASETSKELEYLPTAIRGFFDGESHYVAAHVIIDEPSEGTSREQVPDFTFYTNNVFLKYLVKGDKSLLYLRPDDDRDHFYISKNDTFELLLFKEYLKADEVGGTARLSVKKYVSQLMDYFRDNNSAQKAVAKTEFKYNKLVRLFNNYYTGSTSRTPVVGVEKKFRVELSALAGVSSTNAKFGGSAYENVGHNSSTNFMGGLSVDLLLAGRSSPFSFANDFLYSSYDVTISERSNNTNYYLSRKSRIAASYIKLHSLVRYRFPVRTSYLFVNAGLSGGYALSIKDSYLEERINNGTVLYKEEGRAISNLRKIEIGYLAGAGAELNRFVVQLRFERGNGVSAFRAFSTNATRYSFIAGYKLSK